MNILERSGKEKQLKCLYRSTRNVGCITAGESIGTITWYTDLCTTELHQILFNKEYKNIRRDKNATNKQAFVANPNCSEPSTESQFFATERQIHLQKHNTHHSKWRLGFSLPIPCQNSRDFNGANGGTALSCTANSSPSIINTSTSNSRKTLDKYFNIRVELN